MTEILRLFIGITFNDHLKNSLCELISELKTNTKQGSFTKRDNLHLTLAFIGETKDVAGAKQAIDKTMDKLRMERFPLQIEGIGAFRRREGDIVWVGVKDNPSLVELQKVLVEELRKKEFKVDDRIYKPHLTLGRRVHLNQNYNLEERAKNLPSFAMIVERISLMKSERIEGKLVYTKIYEYELM